MPQHTVHVSTELLRQVPTSKSSLPPSTCHHHYAFWLGQQQWQGRPKQHELCHLGLRYVYLTHLFFCHVSFIWIHHRLVGTNNNDECHFGLGKFFFNLFFLFFFFSFLRFSPGPLSSPHHYRYTFHKTTAITSSRKKAQCWCLFSHSKFFYSYHFILLTKSILDTYVATEIHNDGTAGRKGKRMTCRHNVGTLSPEKA